MVGTPSRRQPTICSLVIARQNGGAGSNSFGRGIARTFQEKQLLDDPEVVSPHRRPVHSLSMDTVGGRFLLAGSADRTVSIYDLSKWGSESFTKNHGERRPTVYHPVARSMAVETNENELIVPAGSSTSLSHVQWYPTDTGAFVTSSRDGTMLLWDTNRMQPVLRAQPFESCGSSCGHLQTWGDHSLFATGSASEFDVKLVDIRSGSHSHSLTGHQSGITALQWSPTTSVVLASGCRNGAIRLWDVRKSGSRACITTLDREATPSHMPNGSYKGDYSHLRETAKRKSGTTRNHKRIRVAPNNYSRSQSTNITSHFGKVATLSFFPSGHSLVSFGGTDQDLLMWDLSSGRLVPSKFIVPHQGVLPASTGLAVDGQGSTIWITNQDQILGFPVSGGGPAHTLRGHLSSVLSLDKMEPGQNLVTGSADGMILSWGKPRISGIDGPVVREDRDRW